MANIDRGMAAAKLAEVFYIVGVERGVESVFASLRRPGGQDKQKWETIRQWYDSQPDEVKELLKFVVEEATILTAFGLLVYLDGDTEDPLIGDHVAEFVVSARLYLNEDQLDAGNVEQVIEVCPTIGGDAVHDLFLDLVDEARGSKP